MRYKHHDIMLFAHAQNLQIYANNTSEKIFVKDIRAWPIDPLPPPPPRIIVRQERVVLCSHIFLQMLQNKMFKKKTFPQKLQPVSIDNDICHVREITL